MLFNSLGFIFFLPSVFILYWFILKKNLGSQNILLLLASYFFYSCWDWRFSFLLAFSTGLDFWTGRTIYNSNFEKSKKAWLIISVVINLSILGFFKYHNFFIESFGSLFEKFGVSVNYSPLNIILPIGISFYTFHGLSYVFDIYYNKIKPSNNFVNYSLFVSFFPLLVAGPIERATHLLPQIEKRRLFNYSKAVDGLRQILWGLFKKLVIADGCAIYANQIFNNSDSYSGSTLLLGAIFFTFQIYGDFSGYSDIALGTARLFGFELLQNFKFPYFSRDIAEFWRRWHISLSSWFKDYLYVPLGGSKSGMWKTIRNAFIIFIVSGFWHGANWTFIIWGLLNAIYILPSIIFKTHRHYISIVAEGKLFPSIQDFLRMILTFILVVFAWIVFRAEDINHAYRYINGIFLINPIVAAPEIMYSKFTLMSITLFLIFEWIGREGNYAIENIERLISFRTLRWVTYSLLFFIILFSLHTRSNQTSEFIYFQF